MAELNMVFEIPKSCLACTFNQNKWCSLKMFLNDETDNFVANYTLDNKRSPYCPLERECAVQLEDPIDAILEDY